MFLELFHLFYELAVPLSFIHSQKHYLTFISELSHYFPSFIYKRFPPTFFHPHTQTHTKIFHFYFFTSRMRYFFNPFSPLTRTIWFFQHYLKLQTFLCFFLPAECFNPKQAFHYLPGKLICTRNSYSLLFYFFVVAAETVQK